MKRSRKFILGFVLLLLAGAATVALANLWKSKLVVEHVTVSGNSLIEPGEILKLARVRAGSKMVDLDLLAIERAVATHPYVDNVVVERNLPSTVHIRIGERRPLALLNGADLRYIDREGVVLPNSVSRELFDLPVITGLSGSLALTPGTVIADADLREALSILETSKFVGGGLYHLISEVRLRGQGDLLLYTADGGVPVIFGRGNAPHKLVMLDTFWQTVVAQRGPQQLQYLDLRFEDQIVARWKQKT